jgi:hypothetical protein
VRSPAGDAGDATAAMARSSIDIPSVHVHIAVLCLQPARRRPLRAAPGRLLGQRLPRRPAGGFVSELTSVNDLEPLSPSRIDLRRQALPRALRERQGRQPLQRVELDLEGRSTRPAQQPWRPPLWWPKWGKFGTYFDIPSPMLILPTVRIERTIYGQVASHCGGHRCPYTLLVRLKAFTGT